MSIQYSKLLGLLSSVTPKKYTKVARSLLGRIKPIFDSLTPAQVVAFSNANISLDLKQYERSREQLSVLLDSMIAGKLLDATAIEAMIDQLAGSGPDWVKRIRTILIWVILAAGQLTSILGFIVGQAQ